MSVEFNEWEIPEWDTPDTRVSHEAREIEQIADAREVFKKSFENDEDFRNGYQANIAMLLHDRYGITDYVTRNEAANDIMAVIFDTKDIKPVISDPKNKIKSRFEILDL